MNAGAMEQPSSRPARGLTADEERRVAALDLASRWALRLAGADANFVLATARQFAKFIADGDVGERAEGPSEQAGPGEATG